MNTVNVGDENTLLKLVGGEDFAKALGMPVTNVDDFTPIEGRMRQNPTTHTLEIFNGTVWVPYTPASALTNYVTQSDLDDSEEQMQQFVISGVTPMPDDFLVTSSVQGFNSLGYSLRYKTDVFRSVNLKPLIPSLSTNITEVLRNGNDLVLTANNSATTTSATPILLIRLKNCKIIENILTWEAVYYANLTVNVRVHGATMHKGFLYLQTRPGTGSGLGIQTIKINPNDLGDTKTLELPVLYGTATDIIGYKDALYMLVTYRATIGGPVDVKFIKIDENLNSYSTVFSHTSSSSGGINPNMHAFQYPFLIYNDEIYVVYTSQLSPTTVSVYVYNFRGQILRNNTFSISGVGVTSTAGFAPHWMTIFNGKLIVSASDVSVTTGGRWNLLRVDIQTLALEEDYLLPCSVTDDNTVFSNGTIWLNGEGTNYNTTYLMSLNYKNFAGTKVNELVPFCSVGSINTAHLISKEKNKISLRDFNNDGPVPYATAITDVVQNAPITGTTSETIAKSKLVPAGYFSDGGILIEAILSKTGTNGVITWKVYKNTVNSLAGATQIASYSNVNTIATSFFNRKMFIANNNLYGYTFGGSLMSNENTTSGAAITGTAFDVSQDIYIIVTAQLANAADTAVVSHLSILFTKAT